jgi:predicted DNA-binding transcriptional regulator YafY
VTRPTARVLALLELLQAGGVRTVPDLAARLGVDERTVRRYAGHLTDLGVPVEARRGRYGGYRIGPGYKLPPLMLTDDEAIAVVLGLVAAGRTGLVATAREGGGAAVDSALAKVRRVLPAGLAERLDALLSTVDFTARERRAVPAGSDILLVLADAARRRHQVSIVYTGWRGTPTERVLSPYGLVFHNGRWYVTGLDSATAEVRTFRLDRFASAVAVPARTFEVPAGFDPAAHVLAGLGSVPYTYEVSVVLHAPVEEVRRSVSPALGSITEVEGGARVVLRAEHLPGVAALLAGLGWTFVVERPDELRDAVRELAEKLRTSAAAPAPEAADPR